MKTRIFLFFVAITVMALRVNAQKLQTRQLLSLKKNERIIFSDEHSLRIRNGKNDFFVIIERKTGDKTQSFAIHNEKEMGPYDTIFYPEMGIMESEKGYYFVAAKDNQKYVNINGKEYGGYDEVNPKGNCCYHLLLNKNKDFAFSFRNGDKWYINANGNTYETYQKSGYRFNWFNLKLMPDGNFYYLSKNGDKTVVFINGKEYASVDKLFEINMFEGGDFWYLCENNDNYFANYNGHELGPFEQIGYRDSNDKGFCFTYKDGEKWYALVNGEKRGPYDETSGYYGVKYTDENRYWYGYQNDDNWYVAVGKQEFGPFENSKIPVYFTEKDNGFAYQYKEAGQWYIRMYKRGDKKPLKEFGPYDDAMQMNLVSTDTYCFGIKKGEKQYLIINGQEFGPYDGLKTWEFEEVLADDGETFLFSYKLDNKWYARYKSKTFGPYDNFYYKSHSKNDYCFTYKNDTAYYINQSGKETGPYTRCYNQYQENGTNCHYCYINDNRVVVFNHKQYPVLSHAYLLTLKTSDDGKHILIADNGNYLLSIDGKELNDHYGFAYYYDKELDSFIWLTVKERNIYYNQYKLK